MLIAGVQNPSLGTGAVQEMRTYKEAEQAGKHVGFELLGSIDIAVASPVAGPWYARALSEPSLCE